tara:strand:+ start:310 stop:1461 length:1152 start_codon:yes stop_codon:yes gene_type:complete
MGCSVSNNNKRNIQKNDSPAELSVIKFFESSSDSVDIYINYKIKSTKIIYKKINDKFVANIRNQVMISDNSSNVLLIDKIWYDKDEEYDFDMTRLKDKYIRKSFKCRVPIDREIKVSIEIIDWSNNHNKWQLSEVINTNYVNGIDNISLYNYDYNGVANPSINNSVNKGDSILVEFQYIEESKVKLEQDFIYSIIQYEDTISHGIINNNNRNYYFSEKLDNKVFGEVDIVISNDSFENIISIDIVDDFVLWSTDIDDLIGPMEYILSDNQFSILNQMKKNEKIEFIKNFWQNSDPNYQTEDNELLIEFIDRIKFSNKNFSIIDSGWKSDKGKIYIMYGEPFLIDPPYEDEFGNMYEVWKYEDGREFTFIDRGVFGDYKIYRWN